jgi:hypothetical protein
MARRLLPSHKPTDLSESESDSEMEFSQYGQVKQLRQDNLMLENLASHELEQGETNVDDRQETIVNQIVKPSTSSERNNQVPPHDLLQAIWYNIQRNESRKKEREIDEKNRWQRKRKMKRS